MSGIHVRHWPGEPARPGLAIHCMMGSSGAFAPMAERLGGRVDLRAFDLPSHGRSAPWSPVAGEDYHSAVTRIAGELLDNGPMDLIGHSLGGTVALRLAVQAPHRVRSLTLIEPVLFAAAKMGYALDAGLTAAAEAGDFRTATRLFLDAWGRPGGFETLPRMMQEAAIARMPLVIETDAALGADVHGILRPGGLETISAPVMLIAGAETHPVISGISETLAGRLPDLRRATVPGAGHMLPLTHPAEVAGLVALNLDRA